MKIIIQYQIMWVRYNTEDISVKLNILLSLWNLWNMWYTITFCATRELMHHVQICLRNSCGMPILTRFFSSWLLIGCLLPRLTIKFSHLTWTVMLPESLICFQYLTKYVTASNRFFRRFLIAEQNFILEFELIKCTYQFCKNYIKMFNSVLPSLSNNFL